MAAAKVLWNEKYNAVARVPSRARRIPFRGLHVTDYPGESFLFSVTWPDGQTTTATLTPQQALSFPLTRQAFLRQTGQLLRHEDFERPGRAGRRAWLDWLASELNRDPPKPLRPIIPVEIMAQRSMN
jgi:hypothetical protein